MEQIQFKKGQLLPLKRGGAGLHCIGKNRYVLVGGANRSEELSDIWYLSINESREAVWEKIELPLSSFTPRSSQASASVIDGSSIYIYGGQNFTTNKHFNDFLQLTLGEDPSMVRLNQSSKALSKNNPSERNSSTLVYNHLDNQLLLFGGADSEEPLNDLFVYDLDLDIWRRQETNFEGCDKIKGLEMHTAHFYSSSTTQLKKKNQKKKKNKKQASKESSSIIDINIGDFTKERDQSGVPQPHEKVVKLAKVNIEFDADNAVIIDDETEEEPVLYEEGVPASKVEEHHPSSKTSEAETNKEEEEEEVESKQTKSMKKYMIVVGGRYLDSVKQDIYALDLETFNWRRIKELPFGLCAHSSTIVDDCLYIYGGTSGLEFFDRMLIFQLTNQKLYEVDLSPQEKKTLSIQPRMASAMAYDPASKEILLFGGSSMEDESTWLLSINTNKINTSNQVKKL